MSLDSEQLHPQSGYSRVLLSLCVDSQLALTLCCCSVGHPRGWDQCPDHTVLRNMLLHLLMRTPAVYRPHWHQKSSKDHRIQFPRPHSSKSRHVLCLLLYYPPVWCLHCCIDTVLGIGHQHLHSGRSHKCCYHRNSLSALILSQCMTHHPGRWNQFLAQKRQKSMQWHLYIIGYK